MSAHLREVLSCGSDEIMGEHDNELIRFMKGSLHRSIKVKWFIECLNDRRYRSIILGRCQRLRDVFDAARSEGDSLTAQMVIVMNEAEGYLTMAEDYLEKFDLKPPENIGLATTTLKIMNTDLAREIEEHQAYEVADSYTVVKDLTRKPMLVTMGSCSRAPVFGWEGRAIGLASMESGMYEEIFRSGEASVGALKSMELVRQKIDQALGLEKGTAQDFEKGKRRENDIGTSIVADSASIPYIVTWEGRIKIPESTIEFGELFSTILKDKEKGEYYAEVLRFQLLWYLRALTCRSEMQPKETSPSRIIKSVHKPKQIPSTIKLLMLPREPMPARPSLEPVQDPSRDPTGGGSSGPLDYTRKSPIEHTRKLPKGFYATPSAIEKAQQHGIPLAQEVQEDGSVRYIETFVTPRKPDLVDEKGDPRKVTTIQGKMRESAAQAMKLP